MSVSYETAFKYIDEHKDEMLALWEELVNIDSFSHDPEGVNKVADIVAAALDGAGGQVRRFEFEEAGDTVVAEFGAENEGEGAILVGHMDTVFPAGTVAERPFKIEDGIAYGPGVLDMKGGLVAGIYAIKALRAAGCDTGPIKTIFVGDEEIGHGNSTAEEVIKDESRGYTVAFNCESGWMDNALVTGRKGVARFTLEVEGVGAHAGHAPADGRSAALELAHKIIDIQNLNDPEFRGTTFNVGTIEGGTVPNAVPDNAKMVVDIRYVAVDDVPVFTRQMEEIAAKTYVEGTTTTMTGGVIFQPMETTDGVKKLFKYIQDTARRIGLEEPSQKFSGGGSDSAYTIIAGVPTVCSMGPRGGLNHTPREFVKVDTMWERTKLLIACLMDLGQSGL